MLKNILKVMSVALMATFLVACIHTSGLSKSQVKMLQKEGFHLTDEGWSLALPEKLLFDFNSANLKPENQQQINELIYTLKKYKLERVKVIGHTDNVGSEQYNQALSEKRANSVATLFFNAGYSTTNVQVIGRGMSQPVVDNDTEEHRAENRRVTIVIVP